MTAKEGSLFIALFISCKVFKRLGLEPTRELIATSTYCVEAMTVLFVFGEAVGACGVPEKMGDTNGAFVNIVL